MIKPILFAAALLGACATTSPLTKRDNDNDAIPCFNATIRKEYLLWVNTFQPYDPYKSENKIRVNIADPTNENRDAIICTDASWNATKVPFPSDYLTCSDPTISYKVTSYTNHSTFSLVFNQTFVQDVFSETILASYDATKKSLNGGSCYADSGCGSWPQSGGQGHAIVYDVQKNGPPSTTFPSQCAPAPLPTRSDLPIRYTSEGAKDPADTSSSVSSYISFDILTNPNNGWRVKCAGPTWDSATQAAQPADWYPCPNIEYIPGNWSFRVESYTDYQTFDLGIKQHICNEVQCQDNLAYANLTAATGDPRYNSCDGQNECTASSAFNTVNAPIYAVVNQTVVS